MTSKILIPMFNAESLRDNYSCLIIGHRASGKTQLAKNLLQKKCFSNGIIHVSKENEWGDEVPRVNNLYFFKDHFAHTIGVYEKRRVTLMLLWLKNKLDVPYLAVETLIKFVRAPRSFCVIDDVFYDVQQTENLFIQKRHENLLTIITTPYAPNSTMYDHFDYVFLFRDDYVMHRKRFYELFGKGFLTPENFTTLIDIITQPQYACLVVNMKATNLEHRFLHYKTTTNSNEFHFIK